MKLLVINGPNLNLLGSREPDIYGNMNYNGLIKSIIDYGAKKEVIIDHFQSNCEGQLIDSLHSAIDDGYNGIILNAGAYTHYSYAIRDAIAAINIPVVEVHISNIYNREEFRHKSVISPVCEGIIAGLGVKGYFLAIDYFLQTNED